MYSVKHSPSSTFGWVQFKYLAYFSTLNFFWHTMPMSPSPHLIRSLSLCVCVREHQSSACHFYRLPLPSFLSTTMFFGLSSIVQSIQNNRAKIFTLHPCYVLIHIRCHTRIQPMLYAYMCSTWCGCYYISFVIHLSTYRKANTATIWLWMLIPRR